MTAGAWLPGQLAVEDRTALCAVAAVCGALCLWLALGSGETAVRRARLLCARGGTPGSHGRDVPPGEAGRRPPRRRGRSGRLVAAAQRAARRAGPVWAVPVAGVLLGWWGGSLVPPLAGVLAVPLARRRLGAVAARREAERREAAVIELCATVAAEARAGLQPEQALLAADGPALRDTDPAVWAAARFGGDVPSALRVAADRPGAQGLRGMAACWQVARQGGGTLAEGLERVAAALGADRDLRLEIRTQLAGPRATATVLASLPVFGLLLGDALGAKPLWVLLHTPAGLTCLALGVALQGAGLAWVARLTRRAEQPRAVPEQAVRHG